MSKFSDDIKCWYEITNNKIKLSSDVAYKYHFKIQICAICKFAIVSSTYQHPDCGSRYCQSCYDELESKFYCDVCKIANPVNFHNKESIFLDKALKKDMEKETVKCPDCNVSTKFINLEAHVNDCSEGWIHCPSCNSMVKKKPKHKCEGKFSSFEVTNSEYESVSQQETEMESDGVISLSDSESDSEIVGLDESFYFQNPKMGWRKRLEAYDGKEIIHTAVVDTSLEKNRKEINGEPYILSSIVYVNKETGDPFVVSFNFQGKTAGGNRTQVIPNPDKFATNPPSQAKKKKKKKKKEPQLGTTSTSK